MLKALRLMVTASRFVVCFASLATVAFTVARADENSSSVMPEPIHTRETQFAIPFRIDRPQAPDQQPIEVQLHVSSDRGKTWRRHTRVEPEAGRFLFKAPHDGQYWFFVRTKDHLGRLLPDRPAAPELRVVVDTEPPRIELNAWREVGRKITVRWRIIEPHLDPDSLQLENSLGSGASGWEQVAATSPEIDKTTAVQVSEVSWWSADTGPVRIKLSASDKAGNEMTAETVVGAAALAATGAAAGEAMEGTSEQSAPLGPRYDVASLSSGPASPVPPSMPDRYPGSPVQGATPSAGAGNPGQSNTYDPFATEFPATDAPPAPTQPNAAQSEFRTRASADDLQRMAMAGEPPSPQDMLTSGNSPSPRDAVGVHPVIADRYEAPSNTPATYGFDALRPGEQPRMVNRRQFLLHYQEPEGAQSAGSFLELWLTQDRGRSWQRYGHDADRRSPMDVTLDEGLYGLLFKDSSEPLPDAGTAPELWLAVDTTAPTVEFGEIQQGVAERSGKLVIRWTANDVRLGPAPVSIYHGPTPDGPWTLIADELSNVGSYVWTLPSRIPHQIYLRIDVRDAAGNVATAHSDPPVLLKPIAHPSRIRDVRPVP